MGPHYVIVGRHELLAAMSEGATIVVNPDHTDTTYPITAPKFTELPKIDLRSERPWVPPTVREKRSR